MKKILKEGISEDVSKTNIAAVKETVEGILSDIETRGDAAVKELSEKFDKWTPNTFLLSKEQIQECIDSLPAQNHRRYQICSNTSSNLCSGPVGFIE